MTRSLRRPQSAFGSSPGQAPGTDWTRTADGSISLFAHPMKQAVIRCRDDRAGEAEGPKPLIPVVTPS